MNHLQSLARTVPNIDEMSAEFGQDNLFYGRGIFNLLSPVAHVIKQGFCGCLVCFLIDTKPTILRL